MLLDCRSGCAFRIKYSVIECRSVVHTWISCKLKHNGQTLIRRRDVENKHESITGKMDTYIEGCTEQYLLSVKYGWYSWIRQPMLLLNEIGSWEEESNSTAKWWDADHLQGGVRWSISKNPLPRMQNRRKRKENSWLSHVLTQRTLVILPSTYRLMWEQQVLLRR